MAAAVAATLQILNDVVGGPRFQPAARGSVEPWRKPAAGQAAAIFQAAPVGAEDIFRRVAHAAMRDTFDEIAAAIPLRALVLVRLENA